MNKKTALFSVLVAALFVAAGAVFAAGPDGQSGKSNTGHLYLYEKNPTDWTIVQDGAWGKLKYNLAGPTFDFVFNGHKLEPNTNYTLIYYADPWAGNNPGAFIASGTTNNGGNINLAGKVDITSIPTAPDTNAPAGGKVWLVLSSDYNNGASTTGPMTAWNPTQYLFENNLITYTAQ